MRISLTVCISSLLYLIWWGFAIHPQEQAQWQMKIKSYESSPGCTSASPSASQLTPCTFIKERIVSARSEAYKSRHDYYLTLQDANSSPQEIELYGHGLWDDTKIGDYVTVKYWKGNIVSVSGFGHDTLTRANPELLRGNLDWSAVLAILWVVVGVLLYAIGLWGYRVTARKDYALSGFTPPAKDCW